MSSDRILYPPPMNFSWAGNARRLEFHDCCSVVHGCRSHTWSHSAFPPAFSAEASDVQHMTALGTSRITRPRRPVGVDLELAAVAGEVNHATALYRIAVIRLLERHLIPIGRALQLNPKRATG